MAAVETAISRESSAPVALPGLGRALILAGKLEQESAEEIYRKAAGNRTSFIAGLTGSGAVSTQRIIRRDGSALEIAAQARAKGVRSLRQSGLHKVKMGPISLEEVIAVTNE
jgi:type II secretory ATPase GspE/PulE/Tfp pilus assembly ATPase PilB-like protein